MARFFWGAPSGPGTGPETACLAVVARGVWVSPQGPKCVLHSEPKAKELVGAKAAILNLVELFATFG